MNAEVTGGDNAELERRKRTLCGFFHGSYFLLIILGERLSKWLLNFYGCEMRWGVKFFEGLQFLGWDSLPEYSVWNDREFMDYYALQFNYSGPLRYSFSRSPKDVPNYREIETPCVWLNAPRHRYLYGTTPGSHRWHRWVSFEGPRVAHYIADGLIGNDLMGEPLLINRPDHLAAEFDVLFDLLQGHQQDAAVHQLEGILLDIQSQPERVEEENLPTRIRSLAREIVQFPGKDWDFQDQAVRMSISYPHFRRIFRQYIRNSPGQYLQRARLEYAAELLRCTPHTLTEVAEQSGFGDTNYFSRLFNRRYKISPSRYRRIAAQSAPRR